MAPENGRFIHGGLGNSGDREDGTSGARELGIMAPQAPEVHNEGAGVGVVLDPSAPQHHDSAALRPLWPSARDPPGSFRRRLPSSVPNSELDITGGEELWSHDSHELRSQVANNDGNEELRTHELKKRGAASIRIQVLKSQELRRQGAEEEGAKQHVSSHSLATLPNKGIHSPLAKAEIMSGPVSFDEISRAESFLSRGASDTGDTFTRVASSGSMSPEPLSAAEELRDRLLVSYAQRPAKYLEEQWKTRRPEVLRASFATALHSRHPMAAVLNSRYAQGLLLFLCPIILLMGSQPFWNNARVSSHQYFRLQVHQVRDKSVLSEQLNLEEFGVLQGGCPYSRIASYTNANQSIQIGLEFPIKTDGYYFVTGHGPPEKDPVEWTVLASNDGQDWEAIGASRFRWEDGGQFKILPGTKDLSRLRNHVVKVSRDPFKYVEVFLGWIACDYSLAVGFLLTVLCVHVWNSWIAAVMMCFTWIVSGILWLITAVICLHQGRDAPAIVALVWSIFAFAFSVQLYSATLSLVRTLLWNGLALFLVECLGDIVLFENSSSIFLTPPVTGMVLVAIAVGFAGAHHRAARQSLKDLEEDCADWKSIWSSVVDRDPSALNALRKSLDEICRSPECAPQAARQYNRYRTVSELAERPAERQASAEDNHSLLPLSGRKGKAARNASSNLAEVFTSTVTPRKWSQAQSLLPSRPREGTSQTSSVGYMGNLLFRIHAISWLAASCVQSKIDTLRSTLYYPATIPGTLDPGRPVTSLDQLYTQASCVIPQLRSKVVSLQSCLNHGDAAGSDSQSVSVSFSHGTSSQNELLRSQSCVEGENKLPNRFFWDQDIKCPERAFQKLTLCYGDDVSRLVDVCRLQVECQSIKDVLFCIEKLREDPEVKIVRIKDGMTTAPEQSQALGGFGQLTVNLRLVNSETIRLGAETHVSELKLTLSALSSAMTPDKHARYIMYRNLNRPKHEKSLMTWLPETVFIRPVLEREEQTSSAIEDSSPTSRRPSLESKSSQGDSEGSFSSLINLRSTTEGGYLDSKLARGYSLKSASFASAVLTSRPVTAAVVYRPFQLVLLTVGLFDFYDAYIYTQTYADNNAWPVRNLRLSVLETRSPGHPKMLRIQEFGGLFDGCKLRGDMLQNVTWTNSTVEVTLREETPVNGFFLKWGSDASESDPVKYVVHAKAEDEDWFQIGSSLWRINDDGSPRYLDGVDTSKRSKGETLNVDLRIPWMWAFSYWGQFPYCVLVISLAIRGNLHLFDGAPQILSAGVFLYAFLGYGAALGWLADGWWQESVLFGMLATGHLFLSIVFLKEQHLFLGLPLFGIYSILADVIRNTILWPDPVGFWINPPTSGFIFTAIGTFFVGMRHVMVIRAHRLVCSDQREYDRIWTQLLDTEPFESWHALQNVVNQITIHGEARQLVRNDHHDLQPVSSLDQIYATAICLLPLFRFKVRDWAAKSNGMFKKNNPPGHKPEFVSWNEAASDPVKAASIKWSPLKKIERSIEKIIRVYAEPSKLLDLTRETIVFHNVDGLISCLKAIRSDTEVRLIRIKNRMDPGYSSSYSGGFRNICINFCLSSSSATRLGLDLHVCELQMLFEEFEQRKSEAGHAKYRAFRNLRGE